MSTTPEFDIAPLSWIREEIGHALQQVDTALSQYESAQDKAALRPARTFLHQVTGALEMVGLRGVSLVIH